MTRSFPSKIPDKSLSFAMYPFLNNFHFLSNNSFAKTFKQFISIEVPNRFNIPFKDIKFNTKPFPQKTNEILLESLGLLQFGVGLEQLSVQECF